MKGHERPQIFLRKKIIRNVLDEDQLAEMVLAPEGWQVDKSTIPTGYMMHIMSVGNGVKARIRGESLWVRVAGWYWLPSTGFGGSKYGPSTVYCVLCTTEADQLCLLYLLLPRAPIDPSRRSPKPSKTTHGVPGCRQPFVAVKVCTLWTRCIAMFPNASVCVTLACAEACMNAWPAENAKMSSDITVLGTLFVLDKWHRSSER